MTKIKRLPELPSLLQMENEEVALMELDTFLNEISMYGDNLHELSDAQRTIFLNVALEREINNGGFNQYFFNSAGDYAYQTVDSLREVGAYTMADILQEAINLFPNGELPEDQFERQEVLEEIEGTASEKWFELDDRFLAYPENLLELNMDFIRANTDQF